MDTFLAFCSAIRLSVGTDLRCDQRVFLVALHRFSPVLKSLHPTSLPHVPRFELSCRFPSEGIIWKSGLTLVGAGSSNGPSATRHPVFRRFDSNQPEPLRDPTKLISDYARIHIANQHVPRRAIELPGFWQSAVRLRWT